LWNWSLGGGFKIRETTFFCTHVRHGFLMSTFLLGRFFWPWGEDCGLIILIEMLVVAFLIGFPHTKFVWSWRDCGLTPAVVSALTELNRKLLLSFRMIACGVPRQVLQSFRVYNFHSF
jgi:hypothetical protein